MFIQATSSTYKATDMCDSPAKDYGWIDPGMIHRVTLDKSVNESIIIDALCTQQKLLAGSYARVVATIVYYITLYLCSLTPSSKYFYRFGDDAYGWSNEFNFTSAPVPGPNVTTRVLTFGGI